MKQKVIKSVLKKKIKAIVKLSVAVGDNFCEEAIHDFRLSVKSLRSFLRLLNSSSGNIKVTIPKRIKRLYGIAGSIREAELEKVFLNKEKVSIPDYIESLNKIIAKRKAEWRQRYSKKNVRRILKGTVVYQHQRLNTETFKDFFVACHILLLTIKRDVTDSQLHEARKSIKDILFVTNSIDKKNWSLAHFPDKHAIKNLQELGQVIGKYNDERIILEHLIAYSPSALNGTEAANIKRFNTKEAKKLKYEKVQLINASCSAAATINN